MKETLEWKEGSVKIFNMCGNSLPENQWASWNTLAKFILIKVSPEWEDVPGMLDTSSPKHSQFDQSPVVSC